MTDDDFETYLVGYARDQQDRPFGSYDHCPVCSHGWHGLPCVHQLPVGGGYTAPCMCPGEQP